ncbi:Agamous-like MADS-box protein AGL29 [Ananas comosus]|uniref:Agamous-like MADS-box protein AGL29 n=1 Tax=Ananas comosus TaxID=4615 RepID=A0A199VNG3_ANACO|nr:Agamous-like MADS-box protein AGL29 [Ananas comosus]
MGRRKIKIEPIIDKHNRFICFSKRRAGLFKKANQLARRGFQIAVLAFTESGNAFVYGSPKVEEVVERFLHNSDATDGAGSSKATESLSKAPEDCKEQEQTEKVSSESAESAQQKDVSRETKERAEDGEDSWNSLSSALTESKHFWWNSSVENLSLKNLLQFKSALEALLTSVRIKADSLLVEQDFLAGFT